jgi:hypothetical protein
VGSHPRKPTTSTMHRHRQMPNIFFAPKDISPSFYCYKLRAILFTPSLLSAPKVFPLKFARQTLRMPKTPSPLLERMLGMINTHSFLKKIL